MEEPGVFRQVMLALLTGAATYAGLMLARRLEDPYSEPRLTLRSWVDRAGGR
jgi:hypothetical protein